MSRECSGSWAARDADHTLNWGKDSLKDMVSTEEGAWPDLNFYSYFYIEPFGDFNFQFSQKGTTISRATQLQTLVSEYPNQRTWPSPSAQSTEEIKYPETTPPIAP